MMRHVDRATQFPSIDSIKIHLSFGRRDQYVVFARMNVKPRNLAFADKELHKLGLGHPSVPYIHKLDPNAIGCRHCVNLEAGIPV
jgi:hypothetical protein